MSDRFEYSRFPLFYGAQNRRSEPSRFSIMFFISRPVFALNHNCFVCPELYLCLYKRDGKAIQACRDKSSHPCHITKLTMTHDQYRWLIWAAAATACCINRGLCGFVKPYGAQPIQRFCNTTELSLFAILLDNLDRTISTRRRASSVLIGLHRYYSV